MEEGNVKPNREFKDSVFVDLLTSDKNNLLSLCKALDKSIVTDDIELIKCYATKVTKLEEGRIKTCLPVAEYFK